MKKMVFVCVCALVVSGVQAQVWKGLSLGLYGINQYPVGQYAEHVKLTAGGEIAAEYALPFPVLRNFGVSLRIRSGAAVPRIPELVSSWFFSPSAGIWMNIPLPFSFSIQPEISYGMWLHGVEAENSAGKTISGTFADQMIQAAVSVRYRINNIIVDISSVYTLIPEKGAVLHLLGFRAGVLYRL